MKAHAAIDGGFCAGDEACFIRQQERDDRCDLFGLTEAAQMPLDMAAAA